MSLSSHWLKHIETWQHSGQTQAAYCRQQGLNPHTLAARLSDYRRSRRTAEEPVLIPVQIQPSSEREAMVFHHVKGHRLELPVTVSAAWLAELLRCLG